MKHLSTSQRPFFILWLLCIVGSWSILPYTHFLGLLPAAVSMREIFLFTTAQSAVMFGVPCWLSSKILPKTDLHPFPQGDFLRHVFYPALNVGISLGIAIFFLDKTLFHSSALSSSTPPPFWASALGSLYGSINEEVLLRLFLFTLIYWLISKCLKIHRGNRMPILWSVNIGVALLFGAGHLPAAFKLASPSLNEIFRILLLNGILGVVFGWLYYSRGLWAAIGAHLVTDLLIHAFLI